MRVSTGTAIGAAFTAMVTLGACGGGHHAAAPPTKPHTSATTAAPSTTGLAITTIPTLPPTSASTTTATPPTTASTTTSAAATTSTAAASTTTAAPSTTAATTTTTPSAGAGAPPCRTINLTASVANGNGAAGTFYYDLVFRNQGSSPCTLYGYPGVSYVRGATGIQTGAAADHNPSISGQGSAKVTTLAAGGTAHAVLAEVDVGNYSPATCQPVAVRGLRVYPPGQTAALFVPQPTRGCQASGVRQLEVGFIVS